MCSPILAAALCVAPQLAGSPRIVIDPGADRAERHAADELSACLGRITGAPFPVAPSVISKADDIVVGHGVRTASLCPETAKLAPEELIMRTTPGGLVLAGGSDRGTLYAVYRFLGRLGVRWWTPWAETVPSNLSFVLPNLNVREHPALEYRAPDWRSTFNPDWAVRNGDNFDSRDDDGTHGGSVVYAGFVHTYYPLVPPDPNFKLHPEWFSLIDGKRTADNAQLCTTNPELRSYLLEQVKKELRANPEATIVSVSQNDCFNHCQCDRCRAFVKEHGSDSALVLDLANYVADGIRAEFPKVAVDTLAYQWSRHAPTGITPRPNVIVRLCSIECDFGTAFDSDKNASFRDDLLAWSKLTDRLYVWDYCTNFGNYVQPMPDEATLGPDVAFFADHGVKGLFEEGDYTSNGGGMAELKAWLLAQLMWDPHADWRALTREFLVGYYGPAADRIGQYLELIDAAGATTPVRFNQGTDTGFLNYTVCRKCEQLWTQAEAAVAGDTDRLWRVKQGHQAIKYVYLQRWAEFRKAAEAGGDTWPLPQTQKQAAQDWLSVETGAGPAGWSPITAISEGGQTPQNYVKALLGE